ncbi:SDR family oxidoreductase [Actinosynnema sp. NPDC050436]|uniref:SDR family oxidoreductase n=1 Tax=Actinosynnema sp. NPDC050436 TaxID=3155659 RepID=UPI0033DC736B
MTDDLFSVAGKVALVTDGARGIGALVAQSLVEAGARVYVTAPDGVLAEKAAAELSLLGDCRSLAADVSSEVGCRSLAERFGRESDAVHVLVNNAGVLHSTSLDESGETGWRNALAVNLDAAVHLTKFLRPQLASASTPSDPARVLNVGSVEGLPAPHTEAYSYGASKAAVRDLTRHLAHRLAPRITVNAITLGPFASAVVERDLALAPGTRSLVRRHSGIDEVRGVVRFLGSRASAGITGTVVPVDGGTAAVR